MSWRCGALSLRVGFLLALVVAGSSLRAQSQPSDESAIRQARAASNRAIAAHDTAMIAQHFMPDVHVVSSASMLSAGRDENARRFAEQFAARPDVVYVRSPDSIAVFAPWAMASEWGTWRGGWTEPDGKVEIAGVYFAKWQKTPAGWRIQSETYVPSMCRGSSFCARKPR